VDDGDEARGLTTYHVPGHSPSDTLFVDHSSGIAFTGDHILKGVSPNPLIRRPRPGQPRPKSLLEYRASLSRTRGLDLRVCYPGHGEAIRNHREVIDRILHRQDRRTAQVRELLADGDLTPFQLSAELFPELDPAHTYFGLSVAIGHLEILEQDNQAVSELRDGVLYFTQRGPNQRN
jgi:glyoxylase-like metal-dependent hydrolase (beta-lactamase superfamily II)